MSGEYSGHKCTIKVQFHFKISIQEALIGPLSALNIGLRI